MVKLLALTAALALSASAQAAPSPADAPILASIQQFFDAMATQDVAKMRDVVLPGGMYTAVNSKADGTTRMRRLPVDGTFNPTIDPGLHERIWAPVISIRGPIATVSAPYEFQLDGKTTHCGIDVFNLVKVDGVWKIASLMWTVEPDACAELKARG